MDKDRALGFFGGLKETAEAIGVSTQAVCDWPDPLPPRIQDRVIAAAVRKGKKVPADFLKVERAA